MELRVTTGSAKNKKLIAPEIPGFRAVQEIAKSSMFSIIGGKIERAVCLDLFAGSGNLGIEALSRGAAWCDFVDGTSGSVEAIRKNVENCRFYDKSSVTLKNAVKYVAATDKKYDFIFMDPFYTDLSQKHLLNLLKDRLKENGQLFYFHASEHAPEIKTMVEGSGLVINDSREFGASIFAIISALAKN
ncbi:MAG: Methyltransferase [candidate division WWE3 bacterium GW2011_GWF2_41_45]|uniref:16S rRNA (Guanine(966)-N(2))-methyltransferase RsmD n=2 Tax=Katanobacteria TaxID=422282 RepID=A0A1F4W3D1_UNCKA|nr:MAG: Methyltransferase [candidate division WWE3 bacterium GW2011_GWC2_41_23]KKS10545.1 MAG: Methyltransferase [candidate division WWE3 bacterium GW2011_GWF2_41_45]KKS20260.1 MAG: Methyltransferase [candidate division WWE3 bacterium GW2011_GWE1_41_72]KKS28263.1 MAG: Methyltransferase [candidate division WWE3 bacterium GW2011_GWC1_42_102]KKS30262.1 MAG: Methyltransferase [candidate division WWE3 bacterium GW2011_GWD2_42_11]KKS51016.1 MAG: Methyltransferase [candidate division WWE3 bacterium G